MHEQCQRPCAMPNTCTSRSIGNRPGPGNISSGTLVLRCHNTCTILTLHPCPASFRTPSDAMTEVTAGGRSEYTEDASYYDEDEGEDGEGAAGYLEEEQVGAGDGKGCGGVN